MISAIILIIITLFLPPIGVLLVAGCGADFCINLILTILGFFPGHIHGYYLLYVYYRRRDDARLGIYPNQPAPLVFSHRVNYPGGSRRRASLPSQPQGPYPPAQGPVYAHEAPIPQVPQTTYGTMPAAPPPSYTK